MTHHTDQWGDFSISAKLLEIINQRIPILLVVFPAYFLFLITLMAIGFRQIKIYLRQNLVILVMVIALASFALSHFATGGFHAEYFVTFLFCMFPIIGILYTEIYRQKQGYYKIVLQVLLISTLILGIFKDGLLFIDTEVWKRPIEQIKVVAEIVSENSNPSDEIFAMEALWIAIEANRSTVPHMTMAQFSFYDGSVENANTLNLVNGQTTLEYIMDKIPKIIILTDLDWRILQDADEFEQIAVALDKHYELLAKETDFGQTGENVELYLRREGN